MRRGTLALCAALLSAPAPAQAADVPAYGTITIANYGLGAVPTWTYDEVLWDCVTSVAGPYLAPSAITVTCASRLEWSPFTCPLMVLTTQTHALSARAGGRAECAWMIDTGIVSGVAIARRTGNLGHAQSITCTAYGGGLPLLPPYSVTCAEPGLPGLSR